MKILEITSQNRRDFYCDMVCEHCSHIEKQVSGYDDTFFHKEVIPNMVCKECGNKSPSNYEPMSTKYPDHITI